MVCFNSMLLRYSSISSSAAPALALIAGHHLSQLTQKDGPRRMLFGLSTAIVCLLLVVGLHPHLERWFSSDWTGDIEELAQVPLDVWPRITVIGLGALCAVLLTRVNRATMGFASVIVLLWIGLYVLVYPVINDVRSGRIIMDTVKTHVVDYETLGFADWKEQFLLHWDAPSVNFGYRRHDDREESREASAWLTSESNRQLLLSSKVIKPCFDATLLRNVGTAHRQQWYLAQASSVVPACSVAGFVSPGSLPPLHLR